MPDCGTGDAPMFLMAHQCEIKRMPRKRLQIIYSGRVQGVGFRHAAKMSAMGFDVTGVVRNLPDGRVELICEGEELELEAFRQAIRDAGFRRLIRNEEVLWDAPQNDFRGFEIVR